VAVHLDGLRRSRVGDGLPRKKMFGSGEVEDVGEWRRNCEEATDTMDGAELKSKGQVPIVLSILILMLSIISSTLLLSVMLIFETTTAFSRDLLPLLISTSDLGTWRT
jgi:hypothetical protein